ncbi:MAG: oligopeptide transporter, OPT family [Bdellovibrio sp.]|nr:MAG: oligopeptide transporter, OPT family [Bdellovibrio sp.]
MLNKEPHIPSHKNIPELTVKAIVLGAVLSVILSAANAYLGLYAGMTVSASIPAAVISMAFFRLFKGATILENNAVQTAASAGESLAAGVIFTLPALILMGYWQSFPFWQSTLIALCGGVLGVLFTIPLRKALIVRQKLKFPEGVATAEVLKVGSDKSSSIGALASAAALGALFKLGSSGFHLWKGSWEKASLWGKKFFYFGFDLSPALIAVGYIVGLPIASLVFLGGAVSWWIAIPLILFYQGVPEGSQAAIDIGYDIWNRQIRYLGVGAMVVGGLWALISIRKALWSAVREGFEAFKAAVKEHEILRTDKDLPMKWVLVSIAFFVVPIFFIYISEIHSVEVVLFMTFMMILGGFLFSAVAGYMAGLVGSSNNPISGVTIATILTVSLLLLVLLGRGSVQGAAGAILIGAVVCCAAAIAGDNMQDLKSGHVLGATPWRQQVMQIIGVVAAALVVAPVLNLLNTAYGFGAKTVEHPHALSAPQASLMQSVAEGVFGGSLPWTMIFIGAVFGVLVILWDLYLEKKGSHFRAPVLAVAVGLYLPFELDATIFIGGLLAWLLNKAKAQKEGEGGPGLLFASGLITGEALVGILIAIPVALSGRSDVLSLVDKPLGAWPGILALLLILGWMWKVVTKETPERS